MKKSSENQRFSELFFFAHHGKIRQNEAFRVGLNIGLEKIGSSRIPGAFVKTIDLARLKMNPLLDKDPKAFIVRRMNDYEIGKEMLARSREPVEPIIINLDIRNVRLTDFMKAIGYKHPVSADGNLLTYNAPYDSKHEPTMVINTETNLWCDTKSGAYGGIYDLAYKLTGSCSMSDLNFFIAGQMGEFDNRKIGQKQKLEQPKEEPSKPKPGRKMRF